MTAIEKQRRGRIPDCYTLDDGNLSPAEFVAALKTILGDALTVGADGMLHFAPLQECRAAFDTFTGAPAEWEPVPTRQHKRGAGALNKSPSN